MPLVEYYFPQALSPARLDRFLAGGWFRSGPSIFRSRVLCLDGGVYSVVNIRVVLDSFQCSKSLRKILSRNRKLYRIETGKASINPRKEKLYAEHKNRFKGFIFGTLEEFLFAGDASALFDMNEIRVYEGDLLIGVSYFDKGQQGLASIMGLYDHRYSHHSIGIYTMIEEVLLAQKEGKKYYYPGYVLQGHSGFDYKMRLGHIQYYNWHGRWRDIKHVENEYMAAEQINQALGLLEISLYQHGISYTRRLYPFFSIAYLGMRDHDFLGSASYIWCYPRQAEEEHLIIEYSLDTKLFTLSWASTQEDTLDYSEAEFSRDFFNDSSYMNILLAREDILLQTPSPDTIARRVRQVAKTWLSQP